MPKKDTIIIETAIRIPSFWKRGEEMSESADLVKAAQKGSKEAFSALYGKIYNDLYKFAYYVLKDQQDAEDAVSDAVMDAYVGLGKLKNADAFRGWMFKILSAKCKRKLKSYAGRSRETLLSETDLSALSFESDTSERMDLKKAFEALSDEERMIISLNVFGGYNSDEIAKMLHKNRNTVRSKQSRALGKMKEYLKET